MNVSLIHDAWISCAAAMSILGVGRRVVERLAQHRVLTTRQLPGMARRYLRADVERVASDSTTAAASS